MKPLKNKLIILILGLVILAVVLYFGGAQPNNRENVQPEEKNAAEIKKETAKTTEMTKETKKSETDEHKDFSVVSTENSEVLQKKSEPGQSTISAEETAKTYETTPETENETEIVPEETQKNTDEETKTLCTLSVRCDSVIDNMELLSPEKQEIIPDDGIIMSERTVEISHGESVFDVLFRELKKENIHFEFVKTPMYDSAYIEGIGNLYEFDCGAYSGWLYRVNGIKPTCGISQYILKDGDVAEVYYTCDFLREE